MNRRIPKEIKYLNELDPSVYRYVDSPDMTSLRILMRGPDDTEFAESLLDIRVKLPPSFPMSPPKFHCMTRIIHPNFSEAGDICMDGLRKGVYKPTSLIANLLQSIRVMLGEPEFSDPLNMSAVDLHEEDKDGYATSSTRTVKQYGFPLKYLDRSILVPESPSVE